LIVILENKSRVIHVMLLNETESIIMIMVDMNEPFVFIYFLLLVPFWNRCQFDLSGIAWGIWAGGIVEGSGGIEGNDCGAPDSEESVGSVEPCQR